MCHIHRTSTFKVFSMPGLSFSPLIWTYLIRLLGTWVVRKHSNTTFSQMAALERRLLLDDCSESVIENLRKWQATWSLAPNSNRKKQTLLGCFIYGLCIGLGGGVAIGRWRMIGSGVLGWGSQGVGSGNVRGHCSVAYSCLSKYIWFIVSISNSFAILV
jgi:hypothetical protein